MSVTHSMRSFINGLMEGKVEFLFLLDNGYWQQENVVRILWGYLDEMRMNGMVWDCGSSVSTSTLLLLLYTKNHTVIKQLNHSLAQCPFIT